MQYKIRRSIVVAVYATAVSLFAVPAGAQFDHLKCYKVKDQKTFKFADATIGALQAQFGVADDCRIKPGAKLFCVPATKTVTAIENGIDMPFAAEDLAFDRLCYKVKCPKADIAPELVSDQFGTRNVEKFKVQILCAPAVKGAAPTTTTLPPCEDNDLDTYGPGCVNGPDCNDADPQTYPGAPELCNGVDNNCDGTPDDGNPESGQACATGSAGVCTSGTTDCQSGVLVCVPDNSPTAETCDGLDNNCDGSVDEGNPDGGAACSTGNLGACDAGTITCQSGSLVCAQDNAPAPETCDGQDNDCDGTVDEGNPGGGAVCSTGNPGVCDAGTTACQTGSLVCVQDNSPSAEVCDGQDNNCDGSVDEGNPGGGTVCSTGNPGVCDAGTTACQSGSLVCEQDSSPSAEVCDGQDNDCDGSVDEGNPDGGGACSTGNLGVCAAGTENCQSGALVCSQNETPSAEVCDGLDNDCDGAVDESNPGGGAVCSTGNPGICDAGTTDCQSGSLVCVQDNSPSAEVCDDLDNNCDGSVDEGNPGGGAACSTGNPGVCDAGTVTCQSGSLNCVQDNPSSAEVCDSLDNDCDGATDEDFDLNTDPNNCGSCGTVCNAPTPNCTSGVCTP